jgi:hypothetical protein
MSSWTPTNYKTRNWADYNFHSSNEDRYQSGLIRRWFEKLRRLVEGGVSKPTAMLPFKLV